VQEPECEELAVPEDFCGVEPGDLEVLSQKEATAGWPMQVMR
jgi:hypothetical protein